MLKFVQVFIIIGVLALSLGYGESVPENSGDRAVVAEEAQVQEVKAKTHYGMVSEETASTFELVGRIIIYLALLGAIGAVIVHFFRQGKFMRGVRSKGNVLKVTETHVLGNKQFLVVVEYGKHKVLLGVGPGMINKLCFLERPSGEISSKDEINTVL